jgi:hypothetical protein
MMARIGHWWRGARSESRRGVPFEVGCACGQPVRGTRRRRHQYVHCPGCGEDVFVLGTSPLPRPPRDESGGSSLSRPAASVSALLPRRRPLLSGWRLPAFAAVLSLLVVSGAVALLLNALSNPAREASPREQIARQRQAAEGLLQEGRFADAARELDAAAAVRQRHPDALAESGARRLANLGREAHLRADLIDRPLGTVLRPWRDLPEAEVQKLVAGYRGKGVLLDLDLSRDAAGDYTCEPHQGPELPRLALRDLHLLSHLRPHLHDRCRVVFGARLAAVARGPKAGNDSLRRWLVSFEPDSGVLITSADVLKPYPADPDLAGVLRRQAGWVLELP